ncbi:hypothetical protein [Glaciimonas soli]|uniref:hypothetical protein n=1 Tax=Glaciimonas soli TaxID=2590999 RepID=UPI001293D1A6|nr:hypothetical protein [Glaciimonas soli]
MTAVVHPAHARHRDQAGQILALNTELCLAPDFLYQLVAPASLQQRTPCSAR